MTAAPEFDGPRLLRRGEEAAARQLAHICFDDVAEDMLGPADAEPPPGGDAAYETDGETYAIAAQDRPVSIISIFHERLRTFDGIIRVGSVGGVCTHPDFRGLRLASRLLDHCTRRLAEGGARLMLISGERGLYTRSGCALCGRLASFRLRSGEADLPERGVTLRPLAKTDALAGARLYQAAPVHFERRLDHYTGSFGRSSGDYNAEEWLVELEGRPAAYLLLNNPWEFLGRPEAGVRDVFEYAGSPLALAGGLAAILRQPGMREVRAAVAWQDSGLIDLLCESGLRPEWITLPDHTMRILDFPGLMADLRPYQQARLEPGLLRGLRFEQSGQLLGSAGGDVLAIARGKERLSLDGAAMTRLVMGSPEGAGVRAPGALAEVVEALFPLPAFLPGLNYH
jgi:hypothetical protein